MDKEIEVNESLWSKQNLSTSQVINSFKFQLSLIHVGKINKFTCLSIIHIGVLIMYNNYHIMYT